MKTLRLLLRVALLFGGFAATMAIMTRFMKDGNTPQFAGNISLECCLFVGVWVLLSIPWRRDTSSKELPATPAATPQPPFDYKAELETLDGQSGIDDFLARRWQDRLAGMRTPERKKKTPKPAAEDFKEKWEVFATAGDFATNNLVLVEIPGASVTIDIKEPTDIDFLLKACARTYGCQIGLRVDATPFDGPRNHVKPCRVGEDILTNLDMKLRLRLHPGVHVVSACIRQSLDASSPAVVVMSPLIPVHLLAKRT